MAKQTGGTFEVKEIAGKSVQAALDELQSKAGTDAEKLAEVENLRKVDWSKVPFTFMQSENLTEARASYTDADLLKKLQKIEEAAAKSKAYQQVTKPFRPDLNTPEAKRAQMIKDFVNTFHVDEATAITTVDALIAQGAGK